MPKPLTVWITTNSWKFLKRWKYQTTWPASWEICMQVKKQQLELDMEQQTGFKLGKEYVRAIYCDRTYLAYMQSASWEMLGWMKHKLESRLPSEISITLDRQMTPRLWQKVKKNWRASWMWKRRVRKLALFKLSIQKTQVMASSPSTSWQIYGETMEIVREYFLGLQNHWRWWLQPWN